MGPPGLWSELRRQGAAKSLHGPDVEKLLKGKRVAVDGAVWLYEAQTQAEVVQAYGAEGAALKVTFDRCVRWLRKGVLPIIVLEGSGGGRACRTFSRGRGDLGSAFAPQSKVKALLLALGVPCVCAEGEAEATCAALAKVGECDYVATTDFDALLFGAPRVLRHLDLLQGIASKCEVWEASTIERIAGLNREALVAAAFLVGSDYDCRSKTESTTTDGQGVRGVGPRTALKLASTLSAGESGDAIKALNSMISEGRLPKVLASLSDDYARATSSSSRKKGASSRILQRTLTSMAEDVLCRDGFAATVGQYNRVVSIPLRSDGKPYDWTGMNDAEAAAILERVYPGKTQEKLDPLHLEWSLRVVASECPPHICKDVSKRQQWAAARGLRYVPLSAKKPNCRKAEKAPYVLVEFALANGRSTESVKMHAEKKHARVSLAEACKLMMHKGRKPPLMVEDMSKQKNLTDMFQKSSAPAPADPANSQIGHARRRSLLPFKESSRQLRLSMFRRKSAAGRPDSEEKQAEAPSQAESSSRSAAVEVHAGGHMPEGASSSSSSEVVDHAVEVCPAGAPPPEAGSTRRTHVFPNNWVTTKPRDTTAANIAEFFTRSWSPPQSSAMLGGKCGENESRRSITKQALTDDEGAAIEEVPATPRALCKLSSLTITPQKRKRRQSFGGFCLPICDEMASPTKSSPSRYELPEAGCPSDSKAVASKRTSTRSSDSSSSSSRKSDSDGAKLQSVSQIIDFVDLTCDCQPSDSEDDLPLTALLKKARCV